MKLKIFIVLILLFSRIAVAQEDQTSDQEFYVPSGDAAMGREAFIELKCYACHRVAHDADLPASFSGTKGPELVFDSADYSREMVATMVMSPSHTIAGGFGQGTPEDVQFSSMGDFSNAMTVRQLRDIVSYLRAE